MKQQLKTTDNDFCTTLTRPLFTEDKQAYSIKIQTESDTDFVQVTAFRADGKTVTGMGSPKDSDGFSEYTLSREMYAVPGRLVLRVSVCSGNSRVTIRQIECVVIGDVNG